MSLRCSICVQIRSVVYIFVILQDYEKGDDFLLRPLLVTALWRGCGAPDVGCTYALLRHITQLLGADRACAGIHFRYILVTGTQIARHGREAV